MCTTLKNEFANLQKLRALKQRDDTREEARENKRKAACLAHDNSLRDAFWARQNALDKAEKKIKETSSAIINQAEGFANDATKTFLSESGLILIIIIYIFFLYFFIHYFHRQPEIRPCQSPKLQ